MADNTTLNPGVDGDVIASDDIAGVKYQRVKLSLGADGAAVDAEAGAGAVGTNTQRVTLGSDDPAVTALQIIDNSIFADDAAFTLTSSSVTVAGAVRDDALSTLTAIEGDAVPLRVSSTGALHVTGAGGGTQYAVDDALGSTPTGTLAVGIRDDALTTLTPVEGDGIGLRTNARGALWVTIEDGAGAGITPQTDDAAFTVATDYISVIGGVATSDAVDSGDAGALAIDTNRNLKVIAAANSGVDIGDVDVTSISAGANLIGDVGISGARTSGGTTIFRSLDLDETEEEIKATAGQVYWIHAMNLTAAALYLKFYNATAASVTVGTTTPVLTFPLATQGDTNGAGFTLCIPNGIAFGTAITAAVTTGVADNDTTGPAANGCVVNIGYA